MDIDGLISELTEKAKSIPQKTRRLKVNIYAEGLKAKIKQADFALNKLIELKDQTDTGRTVSDADAYTVKEQVSFYCDSFWSFLYSALDVLSQFVNQLMNLQTAERDVNFKRLKDELKTHNPQLHAIFCRCSSSNAFKNLDNYRNCSTHRRQIYTQEETHSVTPEKGYETSFAGSRTTVVRYLCDNPLAVKPVINQKRKIPDYMTKTRNSVFLYISEILKKVRITQ